MIAAIVLAVMLSQQPMVSAISTTPPPVAEWSALPLFPLPRAGAITDSATFIRGELESGRCQPRLPAPDGVRLEQPVVLLVGTTGMVRQIVPQAIGCPTVEQYTVGYLLSLTRAGSGIAAVPTPGWYRLTVSYRW